MPQYQQSMVIAAPPETVFNYVADVSNMPHYLPTTRNAQPDGRDRVRIQGEVAGHTYNTDGYLRPDRANMRMEWGADERHYSGAMQIAPYGNNQSRVTVQITMQDMPAPNQAQADDRPTESDIHDGLRKALESIQNQVTGRGGKVEPAAARR
jgi:uncharacterized protein YndB with AHSA1/START domain